MQGLVHITKNIMGALVIDLFYFMKRPHFLQNLLSFDVQQKLFSELSSSITSEATKAIADG